MEATAALRACESNTLTPNPSPKEGEGSRNFLLPLSRSGRGGWGVRDLIHTPSREESGNPDRESRQHFRYDQFIAVVEDLLQLLGAVYRSGLAPHIQHDYCAHTSVKVFNYLAQDLGPAIRGRSHFDDQIG